MNKPIIEINNVSKKYALGERQPYYSLRDTLSSILKKQLSKEKLKKDEFWALKDVSFDVFKGDIVGVIGKNGAGKSTLLKVLSQITPPTEGEIKLRGRVASLLEVGTGFHSELTGRENIYLNGAILGMKRWEINNRYKDIVEFSEIEKFIDTPVKHYSSGMYMRLAFAVAAHLEPEILIVDEVLAVGDVQFQKKCIGKMSDVSKNGRTVIFVSHNMASLRSLCDKGIVLSDGKVVFSGGISKAISKYEDIPVGEIKLSNQQSGFNIYQIEFLKKNGKQTTSYRYDDDVLINLWYQNTQYQNIDISFGFESDFSSTRVMLLKSKFQNEKVKLSSSGVIQLKVKSCKLISGNYWLTVFVESEGKVVSWLKRVVGISVLNNNQKNEPKTGEALYLPEFIITSK